jgi:hypothetical protein
MNDWKKCVVCGEEIIPPSHLEVQDVPRHYHIHCAEQAKQLAVVWRGLVLQGTDEDLCWAHDKSEETGLYLGVAFEDERGFFSATIAVHGVESEGEGATAIEALDSAYIDLQQETLRITAEVWQLGQR